ncbi:beta-propeller domain-containing protein [Umezawaea sp. Da 62-37]|uniref:beta-propeller domain-containing protein n=1 Tax=Umezawaea sp. Da 62-37 TaxID=3075927 RepID=UPI0028F74970|nr:beta-propeller domain-containing protein [Umezawaea sp. Da 62-37]WNV89508.1 beta-propeller domain-containing protein [Umezawaea sp. Da 62-37]
MKRPGVVLAGIVVVGLCAGSAPAVLDWRAPDPVPPTTTGGPAALVAFDSCDEVLSRFRTAAMSDFDEAARQWIPTENGIAVPNSVSDSATDAKAAATPARQSVPEHSGTNVQEAGVDEPDLVKTDGKRVVTITDGVLRVLDVASRAVTGTLDMANSSATQLLLSGDRALVVTTSVATGIPIPPNEFAPPTGSRLVLVDLSGPPKALGTLSVDGAYLDARQIGGVARVVVSSTAHPAFVYPQPSWSIAQTRLENEKALAATTISAWLPHYELSTPTSRREGTLVDCSRVSFPEQPTTASLLTVLTLDLSAALGTGDPVSVVAAGDTVYGTASNLYVADQRQVFGGRSGTQVSGTTAVHQFDISRPGPPKHVASGVVDGVPLNKYSFSEYAGHLRIATTSGGGPGAQQSSVIVLERRGEVLTQTGRVDGLGVGERIYSVRFIGAVGYVVTFRQTDPLYTLDLADPAKPRVVGELKINGYSAYLHPAGDGRLIGVGQDANDRGRVSGTQVSLFDVRDPAKPERLAQYQVPGANSEAEYDPHAFLYWPEDGLLVLPITDRTGVNGTALALRLSGNGFSEVGTVSQPTGSVRRSLVIGDDLWTVSEAGVLVSRVDRVAQLAWVPFG